MSPFMYYFLVNLVNTFSKALQHPLPDLSESPWWEEGQSLNKPPAVPIDAPGQPWQYWQGQVHGAGAGGGYQGQGVPGNVNYSPEQKYSIPGIIASCLRNLLY